MRSKFLALILLVSLGCHSSTDPDPGPDGFNPIAFGLELAVEGLEGSRVLRLVGASEEGEGRDLDGDGDTTGIVLHILDLGGGSLVNTAPRIPGFSGAQFADAFAPSAVPDPEDFQLSLTEADIDLNGDGDTRDSITALYDPRSDRVRDTRLATTLLHQPVRAGRWVGVTVDEHGQGGLDLDGDGRSESSVPHVFDTLTGRSLNLGFHGQWIGALETQLLASWSAGA